MIGTVKEHRGKIEGVEKSLKETVNILQEIKQKYDQQLIEENYKARKDNLDKEILKTEDNIKTKIVEIYKKLIEKFDKIYNNMINQFNNRPLWFIDSQTPCISFQYDETDKSTRTLQTKILKFDIFLQFAKIY